MTRLFGKTWIDHQPARLIAVFDPIILFSVYFKVRDALRRHDFRRGLFVHLDAGIDHEILSKISHEPSFNIPMLTRNVIVNFHPEMFYVKKVNKLEELSIDVFALKFIELKFIMPTRFRKFDARVIFRFSLSSIVTPALASRTKACSKLTVCFG